MSSAVTASTSALVTMLALEYLFDWVSEIAAVEGESRSCGKVPEFEGDVGPETSTGTAQAREPLVFLVLFQLDIVDIVISVGFMPRGGHPITKVQGSRK